MHPAVLLNEIGRRMPLFRQLRWAAAMYGWRRRLRGRGRRLGPCRPRPRTYPNVASQSEQ